MRELAHSRLFLVIVSVVVLVVAVVVVVLVYDDISMLDFNSAQSKANKSASAIFFLLSS